MDYEQIAKYGGYTKGSAQVMYRKALRKLTEAWPVEGDAAVPGASSASASNNAGDDPVTPSGNSKTPKTPRSRATSGKKRKEATATGAVEDHNAISPSSGPNTPFTPGAEVIYEVADIAMETPTKKPKKAAGKQAIS